MPNQLDFTKLSVHCCRRYLFNIFWDRKNIQLISLAIDHVLLLDPDNSNYNVAKGLVLAMQGKNDEAENYVDKGLVLNSNNSVGWGAKGNIAEAKGDKAGAIFDYYKAIKLNTGNIVSLNELQKLEHA